MPPITRRSVLTAAALSAWPWTTEWSVSGSTYAGRLISLPGARTTTSATVSSLVTGGATSISLAYSATATTAGIPTGEVGYVPGIVDADSFVQHTATDLLPDTRYYARLSTSPGVFVGAKIGFRTNAVGAFSRTYASMPPAKSNRKSNPVAFGSTAPLQARMTRGIRAYDPDLGWFTGDYGYWGSGFRGMDPCTKTLGSTSGRP